MKLTTRQVSEAQEHEAAVDAAYSFIEELYTDLEAFIEDKSEKWQESEKGEAASQRLSDLEELRDSLETVRDALGALVTGDE